MKFPDFFIVGAPRCGTTALASYLGAHPLVCFSNPKETQFFCTDMPGIRLMDSEEQYLKTCFGHCDASHRLTGEGSVWHLYSRQAIANILAVNPAAKIIVMVRNPVDLCISLHAKWLELLWEDRPSFEDAWRLQDHRKQGRNVPPRCGDARVLLYRQVGQLGEQVRRVFDIVPPEQRMVVVFDDFISDTAQSYRNVLGFLGLPNDDREDFQAVNSGITPTNQRLWEWASDPPAGLVQAVEWGKRMLGIRELGVLKRVRRLLVTKRNETISDELKIAMAESFRDDVALLGMLLGRDLSHWLEVS